ncbi:MAG: hypothetical protein O9277_02920 [Magnetospirillum sp.]|nr:hypothetical protein [Magnetospirillum sp.]
MPLQLIWWRCGWPQDWCSFDCKWISTVQTRGVYVIWYAEQPSKIVQVGQGVIGERLRAHQSDPEILLYAARALKVSWAAADDESMSGIENYLASALDPLIATARQVASPIKVNLPWDVSQT